MDRKLGIIHLGRSKSPKQRRQDGLSSSSSHMRVQSVATSREKQPLQQTSILNQSMYQPTARNIIKSEPIQFSQTHPGFFPPTPQSVQQRVIVKENIVSPNKNKLIKQSPLKRIVVVESEPRRSNPKMPDLAIQKQAQLLRKIKVLESRIQQLHQQKQTCVVRAHQQNKRICADNTVLQRRLMEVESLKNNQIMGLRQQINYLRNSVSQQIPTKQLSVNIQQNTPLINEAEQKSHKELKNAAYVEDEDDNVSINNHTYTNDPQPCAAVSPKATEEESHDVQQLGSIFAHKIEELENENNSLREELEEMKHAIINTSAIIEQNNQKIIQNYEEKIHALVEELESYKKSAKLAEQNLQQSQLRSSKPAEQKLTQQAQLKKALEISQQQIQDYVSRLLLKSQELNCKQEQCKSLQKQLQFNRQQIQQYVSRLLNKSQQLNRQQNQLLQQIHNITSIAHENQQRNQQKIKQLELQLEQQSSISNKTEDVKPQECQKCKQLIRTLVKLNQKAFFKTA